MTSLTAHQATRGCDDPNVYARCVRAIAICLASLAFLGGQTDTLSAQMGEMDLTVLDAETKDPIPVRLRILDSIGRAPRIRNVPRQGDDFTFSQLLTFKLKTGKYQFVIDRGPHYHQRRGRLEVKRDGFDQKTLILPRFVDMRKEGWYGGDLLVERKRTFLELLLDSEELDLAVVPTWKAGVEFNRVELEQSHTTEQLGQFAVDFSGGLCVSDGGRLLAANFPTGTKIDPTSFPTDAFGFAQETRHQSGHVAVLDPWGPDMPMLVAFDLVDSIALLNSSLQLDGDVTKAKGRQPDDSRFTGQHGLGRYAEFIYHQLLNCGLRIPPSACSGSGECDNPPGFNRVYVACGQDFSAESWWRNLAKGQSIVSNGPVLRVRANDQLPGHVFQGAGSNSLSIQISCNLATRQKIEYLEIIKNGQVVESVRLDKWAKNNGRLPPLEFDASGWFVVRAYSPSEKTYRCATSAPYYVEFDQSPRISKSAAKFFVDWIYARARQLRKSKLPAQQITDRIERQKAARDFWQDLVDRANAA